MRAAEGRQEVVQGLLVRDVEDAEPYAQLCPVGMKQVVGAESEVEKVSRRNSRRVVHIIRGAFGRNFQPGRAVVGRGAIRARQRMTERRRLTAAEKSNGRLLIR